MKKIMFIGCAVALGCSAMAQDSVVRSEKTVTRTEAGGAVSTTVETHTVVTHYVTYLYDTYAAVGIPEDQISQLIRLDLEILQARVALDFDRVRVLIHQQVQIVGVPVAEHIHTYVSGHPIPVGLPVYAHPVWARDVVVNNNQVNINLQENEVRSSVKQTNVNVNEIKSDNTAKAVESGNIQQIKQSAKGGADAKAGANGKTGNNMDATKANASDKNSANPTMTPAAGQDASKPADGAALNGRKNGKKNKNGMRKHGNRNAAQTPENPNATPAPAGATPDASAKETPATPNASPSASMDHNTMKKMAHPEPANSSTNAPGNATAVPDHSATAPSATPASASEGHGQSTGAVRPASTPIAGSEGDSTSNHVGKSAPSSNSNNSQVPAPTPAK